MLNQNATYNAVPKPALFSTTLLAVGWGLTSAYILFNSLLISHDVRPFFAALVPLVIVWATLERKRWGRLALQGMSAMALGLFATFLGFAYAVSVRTHPAVPQTTWKFVQNALDTFGPKNAPCAAVVLGLAVLTALYMRIPRVVAEFEGGKQKTLATAQRAIAFVLVGIWGVAVVGAQQPKANTVNTNVPNAAHHRSSAPVKTRSTRSHTSSKRTERSAVSATSL